MSYNPNIHHRRSIRLKGYDYSQSGAYFITICCEKRIYRFGNIENGEMILNEFGKIAHREWVKLTERFANFELDVFQIMPNHMHGIIVLNHIGATLAVDQNDNHVGATPAVDQNDNHVGATPAVDQNDNHVGATLAVDQNNTNTNNILDADMRADMRAGASPAPTVSDIVGAYKSLVANACLDLYKSNNETMGKLWQRNYYEHIIRNEQSYQTISNYILNNPAKWKEDKFFIHPR